MSHTTTIDAIKITDVQALRSACNELKASGVNVDLIENATPRAYSTGQMSQADFVVKLNDTKFDVGLYKQDNEYVAKCDFWNGYVESVLGAPQGAGESPQQAKLGKLYQAYAVNAAENAAVQQGYTVQRSEQADGSMLLQVTGIG